METMALATGPRCKSKADYKYSLSVSDREFCRYIVEAILDHRADFVDVRLLHPRSNPILRFFVSLTSILGQGALPSKMERLRIGIRVHLGTRGVICVRDLLPRYTKTFAHTYD